MNHGHTDTSTMTRKTKDIFVCATIKDGELSLIITGNTLPLKLCVMSLDLVCVSNTYLLLHNYF